MLSLLRVDMVKAVTEEGKCARRKELERSHRIMRCCGSFYLLGISPLPSLASGVSLERP